MSKLIISKAAKEPLTKNQQAFNKITAQIEKLHKDIKKRQAQFDVALNIFSTEIHPLRKQKGQHLRKLFDVLWTVYKGKQLSKTDQRTLKSVLKDDMYEIINLSPDQLDDALKKIFRELEGETYESVMEREKELMKEGIQEMFDDFDIDIDLGDADSEEKLAQKMAEARQKLAEQEERMNTQKQHREKNKRKTPKQAEKEKSRENMLRETEAMKQKNISTIYRQLAKLFHPDLEQDENLKAEKEALMKQLTAAYESKNLHELLSLELKWIYKENSHLESLTEEKLAVYLQILREQARELEKEKMMIFHQPRYGVLFEEFGGQLSGDPSRVVQMEKAGLESQIKALKNDTHLFQTETGIRYIKRMLKDVKQNMEEPDDDDLMEMFLNMNRR